MDIKRDEHGKNGAFFVEENGEWTAEMTYGRSDKLITIDHTEVDRKYRGQGVGERLVAEAVRYARANNLKVDATCVFAQKVLDETPEYSDVRTD
jgi:predicted GNAT family acetyltransferase